MQTSEGEPMATAELPATDHLSTDAKKQLLLRIARELMDPSGAMSAADAAGEVVVYVVPTDAQARAERAMREATPECLAELQRRAATPEDSFSHEEALSLASEPAK